jgi:GPH family glycoside/pentoside/hexuronide:cation symporter
VPFRYATALKMLNWLTFDLVALMLPFFLIYWVAGGRLLAKVDLFGINLDIQSAVLGLLFVLAIMALPLWVWLARPFSKRTAYIVGMRFWAFVQFLLFLIRPGQIQLVLGLTVLAGLSVSTAHVLPDVIFPDVIEWDELRTGRRREGMYYGAKNFIRKITGALAIFLALQTRGWLGYQAPPPGALQVSQPAAALLGIRLLTGPAGSLLMLGAILAAWFYPLTRERHARIRALLVRRRAHSAARPAPAAVGPV